MYSRVSTLDRLEVKQILMEGKWKLQSPVAGETPLHPLFSTAFFHFYWWEESARGKGEQVKSCQFFPVFFD